MPNLERWTKTHFHLHGQELHNKKSFTPEYPRLHLLADYEYAVGWLGVDYYGNGYNQPSIIYHKQWECLYMDDVSPILCLPYSITHELSYPSSDSFTKIFFAITIPYNTHSKNSPLILTMPP